MTDAYDKIADAAMNGKTDFSFDKDIQPLMKLYRKLVLNIREAAEQRAKGELTEHQFFNRIQELGGFVPMSGDAPLVPR